METLTLPDMLHNITAQLPALVRLLTAIMYLVGFFFVFRGVLSLKQYAEMRSMMSSGTSMKEPLLYFLVGGLLIFYPSTINVGLNTLFHSTTILAYQPVKSGISEENEIFQDVAMVLRFIGYISFFRGMMILTHLGSQQAPPGTFGRAVAHIFGGIFLVNVFQTWEIIKSTIGA